MGTVEAVVALDREAAVVVTGVEAMVVATVAEEVAIILKTPMCKASMKPKHFSIGGQFLGFLG
jgi:hypothetical protein